MGRKIYFSLKHASLFTAGKFYSIWHSLIAFIFLPLWYYGVMNRNRIWMILKLFGERLGDGVCCSCQNKGQHCLESSTYLGSLANRTGSTCSCSGLGANETIFILLKSTHMIIYNVVGEKASNGWKWLESSTYLGSLADWTGSTCSSSGLGANETISILLKNTHMII